MTTKDLQKEFNRTKIALMQNKDAVFFTTIVFSLKFSWDTSIPTAATNGHRLLWNPDFFLSSTKGQRIFTLVHEAYHVALDHMGRLQGRIMRIWNKAADHVINLDLEERGFEMWDWVLKDKRFKAMSTEQVYKILLAEDDGSENPMGPDIQLPNAGTGGAGSGLPSITEVEHQKHIQDILARAAIQTKMSGGAPGSIPSSVELLLHDLQKPKLPWHQIFRRLVGQTNKNGFTWKRPNRRYFPDHYLPSRWGQSPAEMNFYVDISGSVSDAQFSIFVSEMAGALKMFNLHKIRVIQFDTQIQHEDTVRSVRELRQLKFTGRGGTYLKEVFDDIEKTKAPLNAIFTDGYFGWDREKINGQVIWLINDNRDFEAKFGSVVHFETE